MFSKKPPPWTLVLINQLAFPGLGTILAGRKVGYAQAVLMVSGFLLSVGFMLWFIFCMVRLVFNDVSEQEFKAQYEPYWWTLRWGLGLCAVAWLWSLWSSFWMLRPGTSAKTRT